MFSTARRELKELVQLTEDIATKQATLAAKPDTVPADSYYDTMARDRARRLELLKKYELI
jgi:hypothetical protein